MREGRERALCGGWWMQGHNKTEHGGKTGPKESRERAERKRDEMTRKESQSVTVQSVSAVQSIKHSFFGYFFLSLAVHPLLVHFLVR